MSLKRGFDIFFGVPIFICVFPIILIGALAVFFFGGRPVFYAQEREGRKGVFFKMWKLRTMKKEKEGEFREYFEKNPDAKEEWEKRFKLKHDPRIIPFIGEPLRNLSIDELPQFWNVLRGDMSLVGPRPLPLYHLEKFNDEFRILRRNVKPGITGLWQITARNEEDLSVMENLDRKYINEQSIFLDLALLARTPWHAFVRRNGAL